MSEYQDLVVTTYYWKPGMKTPTTHAYGATSKAQANRMREELLRDFSDDARMADENAVLNVSVNKVLWFPASVTQ